MINYKLHTQGPLVCDANYCFAIFTIIFLCVQVKFLELHMAEELDQFSWSMYIAVGLKNLSWTVITMVWDFPHVDTGKMLELFAKVRYSV